MEAADKLLLAWATLGIDTSEYAVYDFGIYRGVTGPYHRYGFVRVDDKGTHPVEGFRHPAMSAHLAAQLEAAVASAEIIANSPGILALALKAARDE